MTEASQHAPKPCVCVPGEMCDYHAATTHRPPPNAPQTFGGWDDDDCYEPEPDPTWDDVVALVDRQAEDDGLWFVAATATEAYLQQELRRLHALIEEARG